MNHQVQSLQNTSETFWNISQNLEASISQIIIVIELIENWTNDELNEIIKKLFYKKYWKNTTTTNFKLFIKYLIYGINLYLHSLDVFSTPQKPTKEVLKLAREVSNFELEYWDILYFWQRNITTEIREEVDRILTKVIWF